MIVEKEVMKTCNTCFKRMPIEKFHKHYRSSDGHRSDCKSCRNASSRVRYRLQNKRAVSKELKGIIHNKISTDVQVIKNELRELREIKIKCEYRIDKLTTQLESVELSDNRSIEFTRVALSIVCDTFMVTELQMKSKSRSRHIADARLAYFYLCYGLYDIKSHFVGDLINRDSSTVRSRSNSLEGNIHFMGEEFVSLVDECKVRLNEYFSNIVFNNKSD